MNDKKTRIKNTFNPMSLASNERFEVSESKFKRAEFNPFYNLKFVKHVCQTLEKETENNFFVSWDWVYAWLFNVPVSTDLTFVVYYDEKGEDYIACYFIGKRTFSKYGIAKKTKAYLNHTGFREYDQITVEYNQPLIRRGYEHLAMGLILSEEKVDDIVIPVSHLNKKEESGFEIDNYKHPYFWVDLNNIRNNSSEYLSSLSKNKKQQIKRSMKAYGDISIKVAESTDEAIEMLMSLAELHQKEWVKRGQVGSFSNDYFINFHKCLIKSAFDKGKIQLSEVSSNGNPIGYLYSFISEKDVWFYQSGFDYKKDNKLRPGLVSHYMAINYNLKNGMSTYNFLAGKSQYKESLSTNSDLMHTYTYSRKSIKLKVEKLIKKLIK